MKQQHLITYRWQIYDGIHFSYSSKENPIYRQEKWQSLPSLLELLSADIWNEALSPLELSQSHQRCFEVTSCHCFSWYLWDIWLSTSERSVYSFTGPDCSESSSTQLHVNISTSWMEPIPGFSVTRHDLVVRGQRWQQGDLTSPSWLVCWWLFGGSPA